MQTFTKLSFKLNIYNFFDVIPDVEGGEAALARDVGVVVVLQQQRRRLKTAGFATNSLQFVYSYGIP